MSAWWDEEHVLLLLTPEEFAELPDMTELTCINDSVYVKGVDYIDGDTRFGHLAFGVVGDHPLRLQRIAEQGLTRKYVVEGGVYTDTSFRILVPGKEERYGPFDTHEEAEAVWRARMGWMVDTCEHRLFIKEIAE